MSNSSTLTSPNKAERTIEETENTSNLSSNLSRTQQSSTALRKINLLQGVFIWGLVAIFYFYDNLLQVSPSAMKPELSAIFTPEAEQFGSLSAYCLYAYGLMQIPAGVLLDRFGVRRVISFACLLCALGALIFGLADSLWVAKLGRLFIGGGAAFALLCCLKIISIWFSRTRFAFMTGLTVTVGYLGGAFGLAFVAKVVAALGWRQSMIAGAGFGLFLALLLWLLVKERPKNIVKTSDPIDCVNSVDSIIVHAVDTAEKTNKSSNKKLGLSENVMDALDKSSVAAKENLCLWQDLKSIIKNKQTWIAALFAGLMFVPTLALGGLWGIPFLVEAHGFDRDTAGICASLIYLGWVSGAAMWGFISDYLGRRNLPMMVGTICTLFITLVILYVDHLALGIIKTLFFSLGFFSSCFLIAFAVVAENNPRNLAATASGFANALNTLWGAAAQPFIGFILDMSVKSSAVSLVVVNKLGNNTISNSAVTASKTVLASSGFTLEQYQQAFLTLPVCVVISFIILLFLKETGRAKQTAVIRKKIQPEFSW